MPQSFDCDAVLFDLDGVLLDSSAIIRRHWSRWARANGLDPDYVVATAQGRRPHDTMATLRPDLTDPAAEADAIVQAEIGDFEGLRVLPGAKELIDRLPPECWTVATSGPRQIATERLGFAGIPIPAAFVTGDDVASGKPDPAPYLLAAERLGVSPERCVVLEDAVAGVRSGKAAGATVIAVLTTHSRDELVAAGADAIVKDPSYVRLARGPSPVRLEIVGG